jgi:hypothetical protein
MVVEERGIPIMDPKTDSAKKQYAVCASKLRLLAASIDDVQMQSRPKDALGLLLKHAGSITGHPYSSALFIMLEITQELREAIEKLVWTLQDNMKKPSV